MNTLTIDTQLRLEYTNERLYAVADSNVSYNLDQLCWLHLFNKTKALSHPKKIEITHSYGTRLRECLRHAFAAINERNGVSGPKSNLSAC